LKLLLDTHAALWLLANDRRLSPTARDLLEDDQVKCFLSAASVWEVAIKRSLGKLTVPAEFHRQMALRGVASVPVYDSHAAAVAELPLHHRDPFDRILVAQAAAESMSILSVDPQLRAYDVPVLW
jgi:PIN domain nuclease of toxin-antitoxin system